MSGIQKRATQQLATVYKALQGDHSHPSAVEIYQRVRQTLPRISLGTVYRNLQRLVEERKIRMLLLGERVARSSLMTISFASSVAEWRICSWSGGTRSIYNHS